MKNPVKGSPSSSVPVLHDTATFHDRPCECVVNHVPKPLEVELHHVWPVADQLRRFGKIVDPRLVPLCDIAHKNVHVAIRRIQKGLDAGLGNRKQRAIAEEGYRLMQEGVAP